MAQNISGLFSYVTHRRLQEAEESSAETPERLFSSPRAARGVET